MINSPVAFGSSVPQCPPFLMPNLRRMASTTSCDVGPAGLSMRIAPSSAENSCILNQFLNSIKFHFTANGVSSGLKQGNISLLSGRDAYDTNFIAGVTQFPNERRSFPVIQIVINQHEIELTGR